MRKFLFPADLGRWLSILRMGLGLEIILYTWSLRHDWAHLFATRENGPISRALTEAILSSETRLTPRLGWLVTAGHWLGLDEGIVISAAWLGLLVAGCFLLVGLFCRPTAIVAWFLYLCSVKSGELFSYGVDNFTTIGLFYVLIAPLPDPFALDRRLRKKHATDPHRMGFHRRVLQIHLAVVYFFGGIAKCFGADWWNGNSIWRALTRPPFDLISPDFLIRFEYLLPAVGIVVCLLETGYPVFIWPKKTRAYWLISILLMHVSIGLTMGLYLFAFIMIVLNLAAFGPGVLVLKNPAPGLGIRAR